uniref:SH3 domain-binding glutamic acid-rich n=1 Tax=Aceria tosichella TaxID=561515 RepID=A0A6G1S5U0_9ACAR
MAIKVYISQVSASNETKKRQQRAQMILDSLNINYELIDVTEPGHEKERDQLQTVCKKRNSQTVALPPQFFNDDFYCGDYEDFDAANDEDKVKVLLKIESEPNQDGA